MKFENEQHERLHNALRKAGFTYDNKRIYFFEHPAHGYYNETLDQIVYWNYLEAIHVRSLEDKEAVKELYDKPIQTIIEYYENLNKENIVQYQEITKDNIREVLKFNNIAINNPTEGCPDWISFNNLDLSSAMNRFSIRLDQVPNWLEVIELVVGKLKPLPKELSLVEWFDKLESGYKLTSILESYMIKDDSKTCIGIIGNWIPRPKQEELILKIIEVYKDQT